MLLFKSVEQDKKRLFEWFVNTDQDSAERTCWLWVYAMTAEPHTSVWLFPFIYGRLPIWATYPEDVFFFVMKDSARTQDETTKSSAWLFNVLCV